MNSVKAMESKSCNGRALVKLKIISDNRGKEPHLRLHYDVDVPITPSRATFIPRSFRF